MRKNGLITIFCFCYFVVNFNISFIYPMVPSLQNNFSANEHHIALLLGAFPFIAFTCNLLYGPFIDKYGKKRFILIGAAGSLLSYIGSALSPNIEMLITFRILGGFFVPMMGATIFPLIIELFEDEKRLFVTGIVQGAASLAQLIALPLGILSGDKISWHFPFVLLIIILAISVTLMMVFLGRETRSAGKNISIRTYSSKYKSLLRNPLISSYILLYALFGLSVFVVFGMYAYWLTKSGTGNSYQLAILFIFSGIAGLLASTTISHVKNFFCSSINMMILLLVIAVGSVLFMPYFSGYIVIQTLLFSLFSWVRSSLNPLIFVEVYKNADITERGTLNGLMNASFQLATSIGGIISTACFFYSPSFLLNAVVFSIFIIICVVLTLKTQRH